MGDPSFELLRFRFSGSKHQCIKTRFIDDRFYGITGGSVFNNDGIAFILIQSSYCLSAVPDIESIADINSHKPGSFLNHEGSYITKQGIVEYLHLMFRLIIHCAASLSD